MAPFLSQDERNMATRDAREFLRGAIPAAGSGEVKSGGKGMQPQGPDRNVMALEAVHPASLERLFKFFERFNQPARNWPIPRQYGGYADPKEEYLVGEKGPEIFKPDVPGDITPYTVPQPGGSIWKNRVGERPVTPAHEFMTGLATDIGESASEAGKRIWGGVSNLGVGLIKPFLPKGTPLPDYSYTPGNLRESGGSIPSTELRPWNVPANDLIPSHGPTGPTTLPTGTENRYRMGEGAWQNMPEDYWKTPFPEASRGSFNVVPAGPWSTGPSPEQLELAARTRWEQPGYAEARPGVTPGYQRSYYDAHPAERAAQNTYEMLSARMPDQTRISRLMDIVRDPYATKEARMTAGSILTEMEKNRSEMHRTAGMMAGGVYQKALEYGPESPESQERLARAQYLKEQTRGFGPLNQAQVDELRARIVREGRMPFVSTANGVFDTATGTWYTPPPDRSSQAYFDMAIKSATGKDEMGLTTYNPQVFNQIIQTGVDAGRLPQDWIRMLPRVEPKKGDIKPSTVDPKFEFVFNGEQWEKRKRK